VCYSDFRNVFTLNSVNLQHHLQLSQTLVTLCNECVCDDIGIIPLVYIELAASVLMFILGIILFIGINYVSSCICC